MPILEKARRPNNPKAGGTDEKSRLGTLRVASTPSLVTVGEKLQGAARIGRTMAGCIITRHGCGVFEAIALDPAIVKGHDGAFAQGLESAEVFSLTTGALRENYPTSMCNVTRNCDPPRLEELTVVSLVSEKNRGQEKNPTDGCQHTRQTAYCCA